MYSFMLHLITSVILDPYGATMNIDNAMFKEKSSN